MLLLPSPLIVHAVNNAIVMALYKTTDNRCIVSFIRLQVSFLLQR